MQVRGGVLKKDDGCLGRFSSAKLLRAPIPQCIGAVVPELCLSPVHLHASTDLVKVAEIVGSIIMASLRCFEIPLKGLFGIRTNSLSPAQADSCRELSLYDTLTGGLEFKLESFLEILFQAIAISIALTKDMHCISVAMSDGSS